MTDEVKKLKELIDGTDNIVFFGGAGVSTESGIPDFRSLSRLSSALSAKASALCPILLDLSFPHHVAS